MHIPGTPKKAALPLKNLASFSSTVKRYEIKFCTLTLLYTSYPFTYLQIRKVLYIYRIDKITLLSVVAI